MIDWIFDHLGLVVFVAIALAMVRNVRKFMKQAEEETERRAQMRRSAKYDPEEARRVQQIQDEIRRKIAERRAGGPPVVTPPVEPPPLLQPKVPADPYDPLGGPLRKMLTEVERRLEPPELPSSVAQERMRRTAELERQEQLAEKMRQLQEARFLNERHVAQMKAARTLDEESEAGVLAHSRQTLLHELQDPQSLRRAFLLREVLGPPVALR
jgi:hypothetical protein